MTLSQAFFSNSDDGSAIFCTTVEIVTYDVYRYSVKLFVGHVLENAMTFRNKTFFHPSRSNSKREGFNFFFRWGGKSVGDCRKSGGHPLSEFPPFSNRKFVKVGLVWLVVAPIFTVTQ